MAKKRYYQDRKDRRDERRGEDRMLAMKRADDRYSDMDSRRAMERRDFNMISEDRSAYANLPQQVVFRQYPECEYLEYGLNDNIVGVDKQKNKDVRGARREMKGQYPEKW